MKAKFDNKSIAMIYSSFFCLPAQKKQRNWLQSDLNWNELLRWSRGGRNGEKQDWMIATRREKNAINHAGEFVFLHGGLIRRCNFFTHAMLETQLSLRDKLRVAGGWKDFATYRKCDVITKVAVLLVGASFHNLVEHECLVDEFQTERTL